ncbi:MAG TPA: EthD family reductase, partial [Bacteroidota bacterium]|nr:EthD family reductase [Bacteroidota bacterium]
KITGAPIGDTKYHLMAELYYDSVEAMNAGNASPEGKAVARDLMSFAADVVTLFYGEVSA